MSTYTHRHDHLHTPVSAEQRSYFRARFARECMGMVTGVVVLMGASLIYPLVGTAMTAGVALLGLALIVRSVSQFIEDRMDISDLHSASHH